MTPIVSWQSWIPLLQIQIAATVVMIAAACAARLIASHQVVARERLWHAALVGVFASMLVPLLGVFAPIAGPELAILPRALAELDPADKQTESQSVAMPVGDVKTPLLSEALVSKQHADERAANETSAPSLLSQTGPSPALPSGAAMSPVDHSSPHPVAAPVRPGNADPNASILLQVWIFGSLLLIWCVGMAYRLARGLIGLMICSRIVATASPLDSAKFEDLYSRLRRVLSLETLPPICTSPKVGSPAVIGTLRPCIVLPDSALNWMSSAQLFQVLLHETAHVIRRDPVVNALQLFARALFWHHPLVYRLNRRLSQSREEVCDNFVLAHVDPADYAETLLDMTQKCPRLLAAQGLAILSDEGSLEARVTGLLNRARDRSIRWPLWRKMALIFVLVLVPILLGLVRVTEQASHADESKTTSINENAVKSNAGIATTTTAKTTGTAERATGRITGRVLFDKDGGVASGAKVVLLPPPPNGENIYIGLLPLRQVGVDADGKFSFENLPAGKYRVWANLGKQTSRKKARQGEVIVLVDGGESPKTVELRLADGLTITAQVTDKASGKVIPNATIHLGWSDLIGDFQADGANSVIVQPLTPERWFVEAWAEGYAKESQWLNLESGEDVHAKFQLAPGRSLAGEVRDSQGKPVDKVGLSVSLEGDFQQLDYVTTDKQGKFSLNHLPLGRTLNIRVSKVDWTTQTLPVQLTNEVQKLDVRLDRRPHGGTIVGVVQDANGRPIANAELANMGTSSNDVRQTKSDQDGRFKLDNLFKRDRETLITVRAPTFAPQWLKVEPGTADKPAVVPITLEPGHKILGQVTNEAGHPLEGVSVSFDNADIPHQLNGRTTTNKEGRFEFDSLPADAQFDIRKPGYSSVERRQLPLDLDEVVAIELAPVGVILGKVTDSTTGQPIRAFKVRLGFSPQAQPNEPRSGLRSDWIKPGQAFQSKSGQFKLSELVAGVSLQVLVDAEGYETSVQELVRVARSDNTEEVKFELKPVDPATLRTYHGRFLDAKGLPVVGAQLRLIVSRDRKPEGRANFPFNWQMIHSGQLANQTQVLQFLEGSTNKEGIFEFHKIPRNAEVELAWWGDKNVSGRADHLELVPEDEGVQITLAVPARILGKIDLTEYPNAGRIELIPIHLAVEGRTLELKPDQKEFEIGNLAPGSYSIAIMSPFERLPGTGGITSRPLTSMRIEIESGESKEVDFALGTDAPIPTTPAKATPPLK